MATTTQIMAQVAHAPRLQKAVEQTLVELGLNPAVTAPRINSRCLVGGNRGGRGRTLVRRGSNPVVNALKINTRSGLAGAGGKGADAGGDPVGK